MTMTFLTFVIDGTRTTRLRKVMTVLKILIPPFSEEAKVEGQSSGYIYYYRELSVILSYFGVNSL